MSVIRRWSICIVSAAYADNLDSAILFDFTKLFYPA